MLAVTGHYSEEKCHRTLLNPRVEPWQQGQWCFSSLSSDLAQAPQHSRSQAHPPTHHQLRTRRTISTISMDNGIRCFMTRAVDPSQDSELAAPSPMSRSQASTLLTATISPSA